MVAAICNICSSMKGVHIPVFYIFLINVLNIVINVLNIVIKIVQCIQFRRNGTKSKIMLLSAKEKWAGMIICYVAE